MFYNPNKIATGKGKSFDDFIAEIRREKAQGGVVKVASAQAPEVKTAEVDEPEHPKASGKAEQEEGKSSGQLDVEPLHQVGESTPEVKGKSGKEAETEQQTKKANLDNIPEEKRAKPFGSKKEEKDDDKPAEKEASSHVDKDNENKGDAEESGQTKADFPDLTNDPKAGEHRDGDGDQKKASAAKYIKIANLDPKNEKKLRNYWLNIWPEEFVNAILSKK